MKAQPAKAVPSRPRWICFLNGVSDLKTAVPRRISFRLFQVDAVCQPYGNHFNR